MKLNTSMMMNLFIIDEIIKTFVNHHQQTLFMNKVNKRNLFCMQKFYYYYYYYYKEQKKKYTIKESFVLLCC